MIPTKYPDLFRYLVAREIVTPLVKKRLRSFLAAFREARSHPELRMSLLGLPGDYIRGKRQRTALKAWIAAIAASRPGDARPSISRTGIPA